MRVYVSVLSLYLIGFLSDVARLPIFLGAWLWLTYVLLPRIRRTVLGDDAP